MTGLSNLNALPDDNPRHLLRQNFLRIRQDSVNICTPLETEDYGVQTMPDVSPPKWHLAHTSWFFETFLLKPFAKDYQEYHPQYGHLFNSYYNSVGVYHPRPHRGFLSRPTVKEIHAYRDYINERMLKLLAEVDEQHWPEIAARTILGINHEQQHQELLYTDIKHILGTNPLQPRYRDLPTTTHPATDITWFNFSGGVFTQGCATATEHENDFAYDNETPPHPVYVNDFKLGSRLITNGEYIAFIEDGGYEDARLWLSDAWVTVNNNNWNAPLYWQQKDNEWWQMTLGGLRQVDKHAPVCHVSFYEADAFARWAGKRLPTEMEWEQAATSLVIKGNLRNSGYLQPMPSARAGELTQIYGDVWEWTQSPYTAYPGYRHTDTTFGDFSGEYNGKFMSNQIVLRGGSCVTSDDHIRATYRNFFYPPDRWQFTGFRLAEDG